MSNIAGIDLGECNPIVIALNRTTYQFIGKPDHFFKPWYPVSEATKTIMKSKGIVAHSNRLKMDPIHIEYRFKFYLEVLLFCIDNDISVIVMEDLKGIVEYFKPLSTELAHYLNTNNIIVKYINPRNTSNVCSCCGHLDTKSRVARSLYLCTKCNNRINADLNAALNIQKLWSY